MLRNCWYLVKTSIIFLEPNINKVSKPSRQLNSNPIHVFTWNVLMATPVNDRMKKNLETSFIAISRQSLNKQTDLKKLLLF